MVRFGGNEFINCSIPLAFGGRYFILEPGNETPMLSVVLEHQGKPFFEIFKNEPHDNPISDVSKTPPGIVAVTDKNTKRFIYKVRPGSETSIVFGSIQSGEISVVITDKYILVNDNKFSNCVVDGCSACIVVDENGGIGFGAPLPASLLRLFEGR